MRNQTRVLALIAPLAVLTAVVSPAQAASPAAGPGPITSGLAGKCADDLGNSTADGVVVDLYDCNAGPAQQWTVPGDGTVRINGKCLDVTGGATANGTLVELWGCNGGTNQSWTPQPDGSLKSAQSGRCLDDPGYSSTNGTRLVIWDCNGGGNQKWTLPVPRVGIWTAGLEQNGRAFTNQTIRMVAHATVSGSQVRVRQSNLYGASALAVGAVDVAVQSSNGSAVPGTHHTATFGGSASASIAAGADLAGDPVPMSVNADQDLLVSLYLPNTTGASTWDVVSPTAAGTVVAIGDSITDGYGSGWGTNTRWPDDLARRLNAGTGGGALTAQQLESGYQTVINQAHAQGIRIYGIRTSGAFDAVIDLDAALRSGSNPLALNAAYDCGDHLHPNDKGYQAMANAVDPSLFGA